MSWVQLKPSSGESDTPIAMAARGPRRLLNWTYIAGRFIRRLGVQALHSTPLSLFAEDDALLGVWALKVSPADSPVVCDVYVGSSGSSTGGPAIFRQIGTGLSQVPYNGVTATPSGTTWFPWRVAELKDTAALVCKRGARMSTTSISRTGKLLYQEANQVTPAGIPGPVVGPGLAAAGSGTLDDGTWIGSYTFVTADGHESNESPAESVTTVAGPGAGSRRWGSMEVSTHPRVVYKNLYLSKQGVDNVTRYFLVQIPNATTDYTESFADSVLGFKTAPITNLLPPEDPEDVKVFDECAFVTTNHSDFGGPGWAFTYVDSDLIPQFEAFDVDRRVLRIPPRGGQRAMCSCPWDAGGVKRLALATDAAVHIATPGSLADEYVVDGFDPKHGVAGPAAMDSGNGWLVWFDGARVRASNGGDPITISTDDVDAALKGIPEGYAERACLAYRRAEGGYFELAFASTSASTDNDLALRWSPAARNDPRGGWSEAIYLGDENSGVAPSSYGSAPSGAATRIGAAASAIDLATFASDNRVFWQDSPALRDEGPVRVYTEIEWPSVADRDGQELVVGRAMVAYGNRRDIDASSTVTPELEFSLRLNADTDAAVTTTPVAAIRDAGVLHGGCHSLGRPARTVDLILAGYCTPAIEIASAWLDVARVGLRRVS